MSELTSSMRRPLARRFVRLAWVVATIACVPLSIAAAQRSQRGQPKTPFSTTDFDKLRWLEGAWAGTAPGETDVFARYHFSSDSTIDITYYRDSGLRDESATGRIYLTTGRVYQTFGPNQWGATHVGTDGAFFIPQVNAHNTFDWVYQSRDAWTATVRYGLSGRDRVTVYQMRRIGG